MRAPRNLLVVIGALATLVGSIGSAVALGGTPTDSGRGAEEPEPAVPAAEQLVSSIEASTHWLDGPAQDIVDPAVGAFSGGSGFFQAPERALEVLTETELTEEGFRALAQDAYDSLLHMRPDTPLTHTGDTGHPAYTPDWDGDGAYGEAEDYDHDVDAVPDVARFRYPCTGLDGSVTFERVGGGCGLDGTARTGLVREVRVVNARGFVLDATVWIPSQALVQPCRSGSSLAACVAPSNIRPGQPSVVFHDGLSSRQDHYYWYATTLARAGYLVLTYDPAGEGESEGTMFDLFSSDGSFLSGMDAQDAVRWWVGQDIHPVDVGQSRPFAGLHDPAYRDAGGDQVRNPYRRALDRARVAISGNSMGAQATATYLNALTDGRGHDGRPVPAIAAAIPLSIPGETRITAPVPTLMITGDFDGVPLVAPAVLGMTWADDAERMYAAMRKQPESRRAVGVVVIEGGVHTDHVDQPYVGSTTWGIAVTERYALPWLACHARGVASSCTRLTQRSPHLSRAFATQYDPDGSGARPSVCVQAPDQASLGQEPDVLLAALEGTHAACD